MAIYHIYQRVTSHIHEWVSWLVDIYVWRDSLIYSHLLTCRLRRWGAIAFVWLLFLCEIWLIYMCDVTRWNVWCDVARWYVWHDAFSCRLRGGGAQAFVTLITFSCETWLFYMCDLTRWYAWHDSFICVTWPILMNADLENQEHEVIHMCDMTHSRLHADLENKKRKQEAPGFVKLLSYARHDSFICVTYPVDVWHDLFVCMTWRIDTCGMTHEYVWQDSSICITWLMHMYDITHEYVWHDSWTYMTHELVWHDSCLIYECVMSKWVISPTRMSHVSYMSEPCLIYEWVMSLIRRSHVSCLNESCRTYKRVVSQIWMRHVVTYEWGMSHMNEPCHLQSDIRNPATILQKHVALLQ